MLTIFAILFYFQIFSKPKDEVGLFLIGSATTENALHKEHGGYEHIKHALELKPISWDTLKYVQKEMDPPVEHTTADWLDALVVAMDYFQNLE